MKNLCRTTKMLSERAQAIVEFAIVLPILIMLLVGIFEVGRMLFTYAAVNNASREAARYGSAMGFDDSGYHKYKYCEGIRSMARRSAYFLNLTSADITISYDRGPGNSPFVFCDAASGEDSDVVLHNSAEPDRVMVTVTATYNPLIRLIPLSARTFTSSSARTILGSVEVSSSTGGGGPGPASTATSSPTSAPITAFPSDTPTNVPSATPGDPGVVITMTPWPSSTATATGTSTSTPTVTSTPTITFTPTMTFTPTATPTAIPGCGNISTGNSILISANTMSLMITNPHQALTVQQVQVTWNAVNGGAGNKTLVLQYASLGSIFWTGSNSSGSLTIQPATTVTIPGNNATSTIIFTFDRNYQTRGNPSIVVSFSTPGCEGITVHMP